MSENLSAGVCCKIKDKESADLKCYKNSPQKDENYKRQSPTEAASLWL